MQTLIDSHYLPLPSQGNLFSSVQFQKIDGTTKVLVATLKRKIYLVEYQYLGNYMEPITKEIFFAYIPGGTEISSIDVFNRSKNVDDFVIGVVILKQSDSDINASLNLYSEYDLKPNINVNLEVVGQSCETLTLAFVPYGLHHVEIPPHLNNGLYENIWLLPGNDNKIHAFKCYYVDKHHEEVLVEDYFSELTNLPSIVLSMNIFYYNDYHNRISCVGCENGFVQCFIVDCDSNNTLKNFNTNYENPISGVQLFTLCKSDDVRYKFFQREDEGTNAPEKSPQVNLLVTNTLYHSEVFMDVGHFGFDRRHCLKESILYDTCLCSVIADIDFDGVNELILGTYGEKLLLFKYSNENWVFVDKKSVPNPVHRLFYADLTEDGVSELISVTSKGVHVYQHKLKKHILPILRARMTRLLNR